MNPVLVAVAKFVRDLLGVNEALVKIGRDNFERTDFSTGYIVVDLLTGGPLASSKRFDPVAEELTLATLSRWVVTVDFFGDAAYTNSDRFQLLQKSQRAVELCETLGISVFRPTAVQDLRALTGAQYGNRVQVELVVHANASAIIETLRIDEPQFEFLNEN